MAGTTASSRRSTSCGPPLIFESAKAARTPFAPARIFPSRPSLPDRVRGSRSKSSYRGGCVAVPTSQSPRTYRIGRTGFASRR